MDTNEIGGFIQHCRQSEYLRQIRSVIDQRLADLGLSGTVCTLCSGRRTISKNIGAGMILVPCPACSATNLSKEAEEADKKVKASAEEQRNAMKEAIISKNARIDELEKQIAEMRAPPTAVGVSDDRDAGRIPDPTPG